MKNNSSKMPEGAYNFLETEKEILNFWENNKYFKPETNPLNIENRKKYSNILPPPNANGSLHVGHASGYTIQDMMGRYHRMLGEEVLLLPGKDHAGIQTEVVFEKELEKQNVTKLTLGREEFYKQCYEFCMKMSETARGQEKALGLSADYDRELFTLDPKVVNIVLDTFVKMYKDKLVYKGSRIVNWCVRCQTTLADIDTDHKEREGKLWYVKYPFEDDKTKFLTIATSRPETILGDTALVVNPTDERYSSYIGKTVLVPIVNRPIKVISSGRIEKDFGTGILKLTPAHSNDDWVIKQEWEDNGGEKIEVINVVWKDGKMVGPIPEKFKGLKVNAARELFVEELKNVNLLEKEENLTQNVIICERCKSVIEPLISSQWFIKVDELKKVKDDVVIIPENMWNNFRKWMENLRDWPVSRQLWWGYRLPVWYQGEKTEFVTEAGEVREMINGVELSPENFNEFVKVQLEKPEGENWVQDPDVLDTWFSSGQWSYATLMAREGDFEKYYPTQMMETSYDILYLWVSRMVMLGQYRTGVSPFERVYLHGLITDAKGQKMSKSKGNGIDPGIMQEKYGTDALRWSLLKGSQAGQPMAMYEEKVKASRNFMNKIWNASRFVLEYAYEEKTVDISTFNFSGGDEIMFNHLSEVEEKYFKLFDQCSFGYLSDILYESFWFEFCDKYIEQSKSKIGIFKDGIYGRIETGEAVETRALLNYALNKYLKMLHPMIPFITEKIWQYSNPINSGIPHYSIMYSSIKNS